MQDTTHSAKEGFRTVITLILAAVVVIGVIVGGKVILESLNDARHRGGWGTFLVALAMTVTAILALFWIISMGGYDTEAIKTHFIK